MTDDFTLDARKWRFLGTEKGPEEYARQDKNKTGRLKVEPLKRQFSTAKEILRRFKEGRGVLLADDAGLGKTTVGALVAWVVACQDRRVRIYAPNKVLRRRWAEELERHVPMLKCKGLNASYDRIKPGDVGKLRAGRIQVATHHMLVKSHGNYEQRTACDLMIVDEAHRAKGDSSAFSDALRNLGDCAKRKLILTATPLSIRLAELEQLLHFVGATEFEAVRQYASKLNRLYSLGDGYHVNAESKSLVSAAKNAIKELQPYLVRHGIEDLSKPERKHFGEVSDEPWAIPTPPATDEELGLLLRMDRILQLTPERRGERRNDPRFHIGWQHVGVELERAAERTTDTITGRHIEVAREGLRARRKKPHPKILAMSDAIRPVLDEGEKVLVFCHHRASASEVLSVLEQTLRTKTTSRRGPSKRIWRAAWESLLPNEDPLVQPIIDWLCSPGLRAQISGWLGEPATTVETLVEQLKNTRPRNASSGVPTVLESARMLTEVLLDPQSKSTRSVLANIAKGTHESGGKTSHFPGRLDAGLRVMGAWDATRDSTLPKTLYTRKPDIVLAIFNSHFGPDVLVATDWLSEGVDMHRCCRHLIHYELDPSPVRTIQRNGRVRRVGSWAALTGQPIRYAYPSFGGTRDEKAVAVMKQRVNAFGLLLGGVPTVEDEDSETQQGFAEAVLEKANKALELQNRKLSVTR